LEIVRDIHRDIVLMSCGSYTGKPSAKCLVTGDAAFGPHLMDRRRDSSAILLDRSFFDLSRVGLGFVKQISKFSALVGFLNAEHRLDHRVVVEDSSYRLDQSGVLLDQTKVVDEDTAIDRLPGGEKRRHDRNRGSEQAVWLPEYVMTGNARIVHQSLKAKHDLLLIASTGRYTNCIGKFLLCSKKAGEGASVFRLDAQLGDIECEQLLCCGPQSLRKLVDPCEIFESDGGANLVDRTQVRDHLPEHGFPFGQLGLSGSSQACGHNESHARNDDFIRQPVKLRSSSVHVSSLPRDSQPRPIEVAPGASCPVSAPIRIRSWRSALLNSVLVVVGLLGCATDRQSEPPLTLVWPSPPDIARIEHISVISHPEDVSGPPGFWTLFGRFLGLDPSAFAPRHSIVHPSDVEVAADGTVLYVSDFALGIIHVFDFGNESVRYIGEAERLARPAGLALDAQGNLWIVEQQTPQIRVVNPDGETIQIHRSEKLVRPVDIELDESRGVFYVADPAYQSSKDHFVHRFSMDGEHRGVLGTGRGMEEGQLLFPTYLAVDEHGSVFVSDTMNARISKFDADGQFDRVIGSRGDGFGLFDKPKGLALDSYGNLHVADSSWSNVQVFGPQGDVLIYFGSRGGYPGLLRNPTGVAINRSTNTIYVADYLNHRVGIYRLVNTDRGDGIPTSDEDEIGEKN